MTETRPRGPPLPRETPPQGIVKYGAQRPRQLHPLEAARPWPEAVAFRRRAWGVSGLRLSQAATDEKRSSRSRMDPMFERKSRDIVGL